MSMDQTVYFGPFLRCLNEVISLDEQLPGCTECDRPTSKAFCSKCGEKATQIHRTKEKPKVNGWSIVSEDYNDKLFKASERRDGNIDYFVPNDGGSGGGHSFNRWDKQFVITEGIDQLEGTVAFEEQYADVINGLKAAYGEDNVSILWGFINYWN